MTDEHKIVLSISAKRRWANPEEREKQSKRVSGKTRSLNSRLKQGLSISGKKHWNWMGGTPVEINKSYTNHRWKKLRKEIVLRDGHRCFMCEVVKDSKQLHVHHIHPYKLFLDNYPWNLVTMCVGCHVKLEHQLKDNNLKFGE